MAEAFRTDAFIAPTFGQRLGGRLLDSIYYVPITVVAAHLVSNMTSQRLVLLAAGASYEIGALLLAGGQTIGKRIMGTRVVTVGREPLLWSQAVVRYLVYAGPAFALLAAGLGVGPSIWTAIVVVPVLRPPLHRGLHDYAARTIVIPTHTWASRGPAR